ncbi:MAG: ROK family protein [Myxococcota bacterium]|nr:ROK family protein [Myxococcota bacterium]
MGIDLGGTKIEGVLMAEDGTALARQRISTPQGNYSETLGATVGLIRDLESQAKLKTPSKVGVGLPGSISTVTGAMKNCNSTCLNGRYFQRDLSDQLGRPVAIANDADCFALSEAVDGAGADRGRVFGAILGTGVGGGLVQDRQLLQGPNGLCGEWGHNLLPAEARGPAGPSRLCFCGHENCIETYLSGPGISQTHAHLHNQALGAEEIAHREEGGDTAACATLDLFIEQLAFALSQIVNFLDPDIIVLGGGLSNIKRLYNPVSGVPGEWGRWITSDAVNTSLQPAEHGDASGVRGAAWLPSHAGSTQAAS